MLKKVLAALTMFYAAISFAAVDVNTGTATDLDSVKGIGPAMSARIVDERKKGKFKDWNDFIARVKGVGDNNSQKFAAGGLTVNGVGMAGVAVKPMSTKEEKAKAKAVATVSRLG